ncbi:hypothetical protein BGZ57DRAFT_957852 [Hyaloscypha finlandica]|nr:hypothetical protein BGZ57DRAFT_957852 [Hyaloscypha finlandica]
MMADPVSITASIIAILQISGAVIQTSYHYLHSIKDGRNDTRRIIDELNNLNGVLLALDDLARSANVPGDIRFSNLERLLNTRDGPLQKCRTELQDLESKLSEPATGLKRLGKALVWPLNEKEAQRSLDIIRAQKATCHFALNADNTALSVAIHDNVRALGEFFAAIKIEGEDKRVIDWYSAVDPCSNHLAACEKHEPTTGAWFLECAEFAAWLKLPKSFLWLHGIPGCGKTVLSSTIIERVLKDYGNKPRTAIAYFYFDFAESYKLGIKTYLSSLIAQICRQRRDIPVDVQSLYDRYMAQHLLPTTDDLLGALSAATEGLEVFLICDALDECAERDLLLDVLATISTGNCGRIKILATSRSERDIEIAVSPLLTGNVCIQDAKIDADIRLFVCNSIAKGPKMKRWSTSVKAEVESALVQGAKGMFRWVKCQLDVLRNCATPRDLKKALKALPPTLDETYERILLSIDKDDRGKAHTALQWLTFSARPLQLQEVAEAVVMEPECDSFSPEDRMFEPYDIISICRSLVSISEDTSELRLAHYSVQEYLVSERIRKGPASFFSVIRVSADTLIAEVCLTYILLFNKPDSLSETSLLEWPLLDYACKHWFHHAGRLTDESDRRNESRLTDKLFIPHKNFAFYQWLRVFEPDRPWISFDRHKEFGSLATPLYYSSYCCLLDATRNLLYRGANVDARGGHYSTPLNAAASRIAHPDSEAVIHLLIQSKADINMVDDRGWGPLHQTCWFGNAQVAKLLLQSGANIDSQDLGGGSPMHLASFGGHLSVIQILLEHNAEIDAEARLKRVDLKVGSKFEARLSNRRTPLMEAAWNGQGEAVQMLLDSGANINAVDDHGMTTLIRAARCGHEKLVKALLSRGADAAVKDKMGWTAEKWLSAVCLNES